MNDKTELDNVKPKTGRPATTMDDLPTGWKEKLTKLGKQGKGIESFYLALGISHSTFYRMLERDEEFRDEINKIKHLALEHWSDIGYSLATGELSGNGSVYAFMMKNRFNWSDKSQIDHTTNGQSIQPTTIKLIGLDSNSD
jgi:hypothetical protein